MVKITKGDPAPRDPQSPKQTQLEAAGGRPLLSVREGSKGRPLQPPPDEPRDQRPKINTIFHKSTGEHNETQCFAMFPWSQANTVPPYNESTAPAMPPREPSLVLLPRQPLPLPTAHRTRKRARHTQSVVLLIVFDLLGNGQTQARRTYTGMSVGGF